MVSGVKVKEWEMVQTGEMFYKAVVQGVLLYGSDIWFITDMMMKFMGGLYHHIAWRIAEKTE